MMERLVVEERAEGVEEATCVITGHDYVWGGVIIVHGWVMIAHGWAIIAYECWS